MPSFCVVLNCCDKYGHSDSASFHKFSFKRKDLLQHWTDFTQRGPDWKPTKWSAICSQHFTAEDFNCAISRKMLKKTAVPSIRGERRPQVNVDDEVATEEAVGATIETVGSLPEIVETESKQRTPEKKRQQEHNQTAMEHIGYENNEGVEVRLFPKTMLLNMGRDHNSMFNCRNNGNTTGVTDASNTLSNGIQRTAMPSYCNAQYPFKVLSNLNQLREQSRFCDVEIVAGGATYNAHRAVLSAASAYFEAMFRPELGLNEGKQKSVILHTIDGEIMHILLDFIYTGRCEITQSNVQELLAAADMLQLHEVVDGCCEFLCRELHATNALGILSFAEAHNCESLAKSALNFVHANFPAITLEDEFLDAPQTLLSQLLTSELLRVDSESQVFQAALRWIKHDVTQRRCFVFDILSHVRLALVPVKVIDQALKDCRDMSVKIALRSICRDIASKRGQLVPLRVCQRQLAKKNINIIGGSRRETPRTWNPADCIFEAVAKFDIFRREWSETAPMEIGRILPGVAALNGKIYVIGGERGSQILANGEVYDPQNDIWQPIAPMIVPRCEFGLCTMGGQLLAVGGWIGDDIGGSMECYEPEKDAWQMIGDLPEPRFSMGVVSFEGLIFIVGGCTTSSRHLPDLISYNPVTKEWQPLARMQTARCQMGVAILDLYLYVVGGNSSAQDVLSSVERYSFDENKWVTVCSMSVPRAIPAVAAADGLLYVAGGDQPCEVNFYRTLSDTWKNCPDLPMSRSEAGAVVV